MGLIYALSGVWLLHSLVQSAVARVFNFYGRPGLLEFFSGAELTEPYVYDDVRFSIAAVQIFAFGLVGTIFLWVYFGREGLKTAFCQKTNLSRLFFAVAAVVLAQPAIQWTVLDPESFSLPWSEWESELERVEARNARLLQGLLPHRLGLNLLVVAFLPAIMEELFFRGLILKLLQSVLGGHSAVWLSALLFSALHFQAFGFVGRTLLGAMFGYMTVFSAGSLWPAVAAHFVNNAVYVAAAFFFGLSAAERTVSWAPALVSAVAVAAVFVFWRKKLYLADKT